MRLHIRMLASVATASIGTTAFAAPIDGATTFAENCAACHQPEGQGIPGAFPALAGNVFAQGPADLVARTVLNGRGGMPSFSSDLTDEQIAAVLTHVRSSWGNHAPPITVDVVAGARKGAASEEKRPTPGH
jgi:mono/diheme cytochrome c family protein